jgi:PKD repeat protein
MNLIQIKTTIMKQKILALILLLSFSAMAQNNDLGISASFDVENRLIPKSQVAPIFFKSNLVNNGTATQQNSQVQTTVQTGSNSNLFQTQTPQVALLSLTDTLIQSINPFIPPPQTENYSFVHFASNGLVSDDNFIDNLDTTSLVVTDSTFMCAGIANSWDSILPTGRGYIFTVVNQDTLTSVSIAAGGNYNQTLQIRILKLDSISGWNIIRTQGCVLNNSNISTLTNIIEISTSFNSSSFYPPILEPGTYAVTVTGANSSSGSQYYGAAVLSSTDFPKDAKPVRFNITNTLTTPLSMAPYIKVNFGTIDCQSVQPNISIAANCLGTLINFTSTNSNNGVTPSYQWKKNNQIIPGANSANYIANNLQIGDTISCDITSSEFCTQGAVTTSNKLIVNFNATQSITISSSDTSVCIGSQVFFNSSIQNGGISPQYQWKLNGNNTGVNSNQFTLNAPSNNDIVTCELTSSDICLSNSFAQSNAVTISVVSNDFLTDFTASQTNFSTGPYTANFSNTTPNPSAYNFTWFFGDGTTSNIVNPSHNYTADGIYTVTLLASENNSGCSDTLSKINYITCSNTGTNCNFQSLVSPSGPILACLNGTVELTATTNASNPSYQWYFNGAIIGGATQSNYNASIAGYYSVIIYENGGCPSATNIVYVTFNNPSVALPTINSTNTSLICGQDSSTLTTTALGALLWNTGATSNSITVTQGGIYTVTATYGIGCQATSQPFIINGSAIYNPGICMVTVDSLTNSNYIIWETPLANDIERFYIYKEGNQANVYNQIGSVAYDSLSEFNDINSNPQIQGYRYKIAVLDTCGGLTPMSNFHKTIHLQIFPGVGNNRQLSWSHYEGINFPSYEISRRLPGQNFQFLATLASNLNTYTDINPPSPNADYRVDIVLPQVCNSVDRAAYGKSKSNVGNNQAILTVNDKENLLANLFLSPTHPMATPSYNGNH